LTDSPNQLPAQQRRTAWTLVAIQFTLIAILVLLPGGDEWPVTSALQLSGAIGSWAGIVIMVIAGLSLGRGLTAAPLPNAHAQLRTNGMYRFTRHPIYSGLLLFAVARGVASGNAVTAVAAVLLIVLINFKVRWEEQRLNERFPDYAAYARRTPRFVPFFPVHEA